MKITREGRDDLGRQLATAILAEGGGRLQSLELRGNSTIVIERRGRRRPPGDARDAT